MVDITSITGSSPPKKRKVIKKLTEAEALESLKKIDIFNYDSTNDEDNVRDSTGQSEGDSDVAMDIIETLASENGYINFTGSEYVKIRSLFSLRHIAICGLLICFSYC
ncbi:hypothetical protein TNCT_620431 [Trichonephila clavata]|uniref:Uncharacterized protein n=1 Tax=Trichonephila clavata TaxID=2740835 RepID=A0A8X6HR05_TRICU|nr:hypothetical protein TNCT_620431 [Trichonephila clavata]